MRFCFKNSFNHLPGPLKRIPQRVQSFPVSTTPQDDANAPEPYILFGHLYKLSSDLAGNSLWFSELCPQTVNLPLFTPLPTRQWCHLNRGFAPQVRHIWGLLSREKVIFFDFQKRS